MQENQFSLTAMMCAYFRAYHAVHDEPKIFDDFLAVELIPAESRALIEQGLANRLRQKAPEQAAACPDQAAAVRLMVRAMNDLSNVLCRARYAEDHLETAVSRGVSQYVLLGAGLDTFAFRRPDMLDRLRVFELDHPATQAFKRRRIAELAWPVPAELTFLAADFTTQDLAAILGESTYDRQAKSFFSWLGVTMYLSREETFAMLRAVAASAPAGSLIVFDYFDADAFDPAKADPHVQAGMVMTAKVGEPMKMGFPPAALADFFAAAGFRLLEDLGPAEIEERYFQGRPDGYHARPHVHLALAAVM